MAIDYCTKHDREWDRDKHTECPVCEFSAFLDVMTVRQSQRIAAEQTAIADKSKNVIRRLMDGYPFQAHDKELHDECKRVLGEA